MAKQDSLIKFKGAIEDLAFFKSRDGYQVRRKSGVNGDRILNDPAFQRTRENGAEFGHAGRSAKYLRKAVRSLLLNVSDRRMTSRLTRSMMRVIQSDATSPRGERNVLAGDVRLLIGFEFNQDAPVDKTLFAPISHALNPAAGTGSVTVPALTIEESLRRPEGATHVRFVGGLAAVDFVSGESVFTKVESAQLPLSGEALPETPLNLSLPAATTLPLFLLLGIEYFQETNGRFYGLRNGAFNTLSMINISPAS